MNLLVAVTLKGVADIPILENASSAHDWLVTEDPVTGKITLETTVLEDETVSMNIDILSGETYTRLAGDESETLSLVLAIPTYATLINSGMLSYMDTLNGNWLFEVDPADLKDLSIQNPLHDTQDMTIGLTIYVHEDDGNANQTDGTIIIHFEPVIDATDYAKSISYDGSCPSQSVTEDNLITLELIPTSADGFVDSKEKIVYAHIENLPEDVNLYDGSTLVWSSSATYFISDALLSSLLDGSKELTLLPPVDSDVDISLNTVLRVNQTDEDSDVMATKVITGSININIRAAVELDGYLNVLDVNGQVTTEFDAADSSDGNSVTIGSVQFIEDDALDPNYSSLETVENFVLKFPSDKIHGYDIPKGIGDGRGHWFIDGADMNNLTINDVLRSGETFSIIIYASVIDLGDNNESDTSCPTIFQKSVTLTFNHSGGGGQTTCDLPDLNVSHPLWVQSYEDTDVAVEGIIDALLTNLGNYSIYRLSIVIPENTLYAYPRTTLTGMNRDFVREQQVASGSADHSTGEVTFPQILLTPPEHFAGEFYLNGTVNVFATCSREHRTKEFSLLLQILPKVDADPGSSSVNLGIINITTYGLDADHTAVTPNSSREVVVSNKAIEDGSICWQMSANLVDDDSSASQGIESVISYELSLTDPTLGEFFTDSNNLTGSTAETVNSTGTSTYCLKPKKDYSGEVEVQASAKIQDFVYFNISNTNATSLGVISDSITFDITPACDTLLLAIEGLEPQGENTLITGTANVTLSDRDGSETPTVLIFSNVPTDFLFMPPAKLVGDGQWKTNIDAQGLASISILPPERFSGVVNISAQVLANEALLPFDSVCTETFEQHVTVLPVAEALNEDITTQYSGTEHVDIEVTLSLSTRDNVYQYTDEDDSVLSETAPEGILIECENVPTSASFIDSAEIQVTQILNTTWSIYTNATSLDTVSYNPGSTYGAYEIQCFARAVDGSVEADVSLWTNFSLSFTIAEANSPPDVVLPNTLVLDAVNDDVITTEITVSDPDSGNEDVQLTLSCSSSCTISVLSSPGDVTVTNSGSASVQLVGPVDSINVALGGGVHVSSTVSNTLTAAIDDLGNSGPGSAQTASAQTNLVT